MYIYYIWLISLFDFVLVIRHSFLLLNLRFLIKPIVILQSTDRTDIILSSWEDFFR